MKRIVSFYIVFVLLFTAIIPIYAVSNPYYTERTEDMEGNLVGVWDNADLYTDSEEDSLFKFAKEQSKKIGISVLFLTVDYAEGKSTRTYGDDFLDYLLYDSGKKYNKSSSSRWDGDNPAVMFVIDMDNRECAINTMGDVIDWFSDREIDKCLSAGDDYLGDGEFYKAISAVAKKSCDNIYKYKSEGYISDYDKENMNFIQKWFHNYKEVFLQIILFSVLAGMFFVVFLYMHDNKTNKNVNAKTYVGNSGLELISRNERYVRTYTTVDKNYYKPKESSSGHSSGSSHRSSGGHSHGGGSHKF